VELLLNCRTTRGVARYLVRWRGHKSADNAWLQVEELRHCPEKVPCCPPERPGAAAPLQPLPPPLWSLSRCWLRPISCWPRGRSPGQGLHWRAHGRCTAGLSKVPVAGRVRRVCRRGGFSHVVGYASSESSSLGAGAVDTLLGVARIGRPVAPAGTVGPARRPCAARRRRVGV
jgi:hypothetical protein